MKTTINQRGEYARGCAPNILCIISRHYLPATARALGARVDLRLRLWSCRIAFTSSRVQSRPAGVLGGRVGDAHEAAIHFASSVADCVISPSFAVRQSRLQDLVCDNGTRGQGAVVIAGFSRVLYEATSCSAQDERVTKRDSRVASPRLTSCATRVLRMWPYRAKSGRARKNLQTPASEGGKCVAGSP